ncbi:MAG: TRAP transporter small permease subunit [Burkholderiaceae bacterium]|nr:TRAP transporter small permease subunit [Burkholderiaceae bacterium]
MIRTIFYTLPIVLIGVLMLVDVALNGANVLGRYAFGKPIFWAEEVMVYLSIWGVFIGMIPVAYKGEHLCMDLFTARLTGIPQRVLHVAIGSIVAIFCIYTAIQSLTIVRMFMATGAVTTAAGMPKSIPHFALLLGFGLTAVAAIVRIASLYSATSSGNGVTGKTT